MKRRTTRKKQLEYSIKKRNYLTSCILSSILAVVFLIAIVGSLLMFNSGNLTENDVEYKEYTIKEIREYAGRTSHFDVYVEEEGSFLIVNSTIADINEFRNKIADLKQGDKIFCYVTKESNEIVEMKSSEMIFSFDVYKEQSKRVGLTGFFIMPVIFIAFVIYATLSAVEYKKLKNANLRG